MKPSAETADTPAPFGAHAISPVGTSTGSPPWTCPFCPLLCDHFSLRFDTSTQRWATTGGPSCPRALQALAHFQPANPALAASALINGQPATLQAALHAAAQVLLASQQPLLGGLGCDVAGARALYALATACGGIADAANGSTLMAGLRALQDRGAYTTTLAEVRNRADVIVFVGGLPLQRQPLLLQRCGVGETALVPQRHLVLLGGDGSVPQTLAAQPGVRLHHVPLQGDLFDTVARLAALVASKSPAPGDVDVDTSAAGTLDGLTQQLRAARYSVLVWEGASLPAQGALIVEALNRIVGSLNRSTRAATLPLGGGDGAATANQVWAWLSGLPLRSRAGPAGLEHEPLRFDADTLLAEGAVDTLLWVSAFAPSAPPTMPPGLPLVVLGHPALADAMAARPNSVFIPVSTPGIGSAGHLFRTDGVVLMPLHAVQDDGLPSVAAVAQQLLQALHTLQAATKKDAA